MIRWGLAAVVAASVVNAQTTRDAVIRVSIDGRVSRVSLEDYVARVVAGEGQPKAADAAQQALAITARTYALANLNRHRRQGYDLCDTTHCQVLRPATESSRRAARASAGRVLMHQGRPASVYYSALCGGHSELASQVWPGADDSSSHSHEDDACRDEPEWTAALAAGQIERALRAAGHRGDRLRSLRVLRRNDSGRVTRLRVDGFTPAEVSGQDLRLTVNRIAGGQPLRSTAFEVSRDGDVYRFRGTGYGHGVGLCVIGAGRRAAQGVSASAILGFYFPNLIVAPYDPNAPRMASGPPPARRDDDNPVTVTIAAAEERERAAVITIINAAREDVARATGRKPPGQLRVTVHPSVDAFMRATGQPWWMSGATDGAAIDLVPVAILRQRGQLERAVRHEVAHAFVDAPLAGRPMWVREGAAAYFAGADTGEETRGDARCPDDEALVQPISAGAYRNALAAAEACFRRALRRGRQWTDVR